MSLSYRPALDGLRAFAVLSVIIYHLNEDMLKGGFVGVDVFFVLSGYLITSILINDHKEGQFSLIRFYQRRIARIFPVFFIVIFATIFASSFFYTHRDFSFVGGSSVASALSIMNIKLMFQGNYFEISSDSQPFLHYWSLSIEEQFYLVMPFLLLLLFRLKISNNKVLIIFSSLFVLSFVLSVVVTIYQPIWAFYLLPTRAWELLAGSIIAYFIRLNLYQPTQKFCSILSITSFIAFIISFIMIDENYYFPGWIALLPVLATTLFIVSGHYHQHLFFEKLLEKEPFVFIGKHSYSLYLWHWPIFSITDYALFQSALPIRLLIKIALTIIMSLLSYRFIEKPLRKYFNEPEKAIQAYAFAITGIIVLSASGLFIQSRYYIDVRKSSIRDGGYEIKSNEESPDVVLIGDSFAQMYGNVIRDISRRENLNVNIMGITNNNPFPPSDYWKNMIEFIKEKKPKVVIFSTYWSLRYKYIDNQDVRNSLDEILLYADHIILIGEQPFPPHSATRRSIRENGIQLYFEEDIDKQSRLESYQNLLELENERISILKIDQLFFNQDGSILFLDQNGNQNYNDIKHLSGEGANKVKPILEKEIMKILKQ